MKHSQKAQFDWDEHKSEGQLSIDIFETEGYIVAVAPMAGADPSSLDIAVHNDLLTIRGSRPFPFDHTNVPDFVSMHHKECFWGNFSRTIVLPVDVKGDLTEAEYKNGVLVLTIPKQSPHKKISITIVND